MTLDEAIKMYTDNAKYERNHGNLQGCLAFRQLAEWLSELKVYKERIPSYEAGYNDAKREISLSREYERVYERGKDDILDKIRAEIERERSFQRIIDEYDIATGLRKALEIIDKYKVEGEDKG